jgi:hypothetical protein
VKLDSLLHEFRGIGSHLLKSTLVATLSAPSSVQVASRYLLEDSATVAYYLYLLVCVLILNKRIVVLLTVNLDRALYKQAQG